MSYNVSKVEHKDLQEYLDALGSQGHKLIQIIDGNIEYTVISEFHSVSIQDPPQTILRKPKKKYDY